MTPLKDLKENILAGKLNHFYVFYGPDSGLRHHYISKISESYDIVRSLPSMEGISASSRGSGLFKTSQLSIVYNDLEFAKWKTSSLLKYITSLTEDCIILVYEEELGSSNLFKNFSQYITYFPTVQDNIALEFVDSEVSLSLESKLELARNCENNYSNICLESDKIKNYAQAKGINEQIAYDNLKLENQLLYKYPDYNPRDLMNDILQGDFQQLGYWCTVINKLYSDKFWIMLNSIFTDYLIAYCIQSEGNKYKGSSKAYNLGLPWGRTKEIRDFVMPYDSEYLFETAMKVADLDLKVKSGQISQDKLFDYFITIII